MKNPFSSIQSHFLGTLAAAMLLTGHSASADTVAHYRFDGGSDGTPAASAVDSTSNGYDLLSADGQPLYSADVPVSTITPTGESNAFSMDFGTGQNALVGAADEGLSLVEFDDFTVETWVKFNNPAGWQSMVARLDSAGNGQNGRPQALFLLLNSGIDSRFWVELTTRDNTTLLISGGPVADPDTWYHVAAVGDATAETLSLYVNGELVETVAGFTGLFRASPALPWSIGRASFGGNPGDWLNGAVDEVRISDAALAPTEFLNEFSILEQPESAVVWAGADVTFSAEVISGTATTFQWEVSTNDGGSWAGIDGATSATYSIEDAQVASDRNQYRLVATRADETTLVSDAAVLRVGESPAPTPSNVVAHYRFEEGSVDGTALGALDSTGNGNDLWAVTGAPVYSGTVPADPLPQTEGANDLSLDFTGGQFAVEGTDGDALSVLEWTDFTIEVWVRFADIAGWQQIVARDDRGDQNTDVHSLFRLDNTGANSFRVVAYGRDGQAHFLDSNHVFSPGIWTHLAVVGDTAAGTLTAYANGRAVGSLGDFTGLMIPDPATHWTIGRGQHGENPVDWLNGQIDEVRFSDAALSPVEFLNFPHAVLSFAFHPDDMTVPAGSEVVLNALAGGGLDALTYQWQVMEAGGTSWSDISGATSASHTIESAASGENGDQYRVVASRGGDTEISRVATLTVLDVLFEIAEQPENVVAWAGDEAIFSPEVASSIPATFQWEVSTDDGETWTDVPGATAESYSIEATPLASDRNQYRLVVTGQEEFILVSDPAILRVGDPGTASIPENVVAHFRFEEGSIDGTATGAVDSSGNGHDLGEALGLPGYSSSVPANGLPQSAESNNFSLDVAGGQHAVEGIDGDSLSQLDWDDFTIEVWVNFASVEGWQQVICRDDRGGQSGDDHSLFRMDNTPEHLFRVVAFGRDGELFMINTSHVFQPGEWTHLAVVGDAQSGTLTAYANGRAVGSASNFRGLFVPHVKPLWTIGRGQHFGSHFDWLNGQIDEVRFSDAALSPVDFMNFSHAVLNLALHPEDVTVPAGGSAAFSALAGGGGQDALTHQWQVSEDDGESWSDVPGATSASYTNGSATVAQDGNQYRVVASRGGDIAISEAATLGVTAYPAPVIVQGLGAGRLAFAGQEFSLSVEATGAGNLTYQWQRDGVDLEEETGATLDFGVVGFAAADTYSVIVTDEGAVQEGLDSTTVTLSTVLSVAPSPAEAISLNFVGAADGFPGFSQELAIIAADEIAGLAPVANWNNSTPDFPTQNTPMALVDDLGEPTSATATWAAFQYWGARLTGGALAEKHGSQKIYHGYIEDRANSTATITGIPYGTYDVYVYPVGVDGASGEFIRSITVEDENENATTLYGRNFGGANPVLPVPFHVATATSLAEAEAAATATVFRFAGVTGASVTITHSDVQGFNLGGIVGISIVNTTAGAPARPVFTSRPSGRFVPAGGDVSLSVAAQSVNAGGSLSYQWQKDGANIGGATDSTLMIDGSSSLATGTYTVVVTDTSSLGTSMNKASVPVVIVDNAEPVLISADMNSGVHDHMSGNGSLRPEGLSTSNIGDGDTQWKRMAEGLLEPTYRDFTDAEGLGLAGLTFTAVGASGIHDSPLGGGMEPPLDGFSAPLLRDYIYTTNDDAMTMTLGGLKAFAGREVTLVVYALGRDSTEWPMAGTEVNGAQNDVATVTLAAQNSPTGEPQSGVTDQVEGRDIEFNILSYVAFDAVVALNGTLVWEVGAVPGEPGLNAFNGFQLLVTDGGDGPFYTAIETWRETHFGTVEDSGDAALGADPDGDSLNNLLEYALGSNPRVAGDGPGAVISEEVGGFLTLTFSHIDDSSLTYAIEAADDLGAGWTVTETYNPFTTIGEETYTDSVSVGGASRRFLRLKVTLEE